MEKVKKLFSPGHEEDDGRMYSSHAAGRSDHTYGRDSVSERNDTSFTGASDTPTQSGNNPGTESATTGGGERYETGDAKEIGTGTTGSSGYPMNTSNDADTGDAMNVGTGAPSATSGSSSRYPFRKGGSTSDTQDRMNVGTGAPTGTSGAPQIDRQEFGDSSLEGPTTSSYGGAGQQTTLADRSVGTGLSSGYGGETFAERGVDLTGDAHPTFTGNRLDPNFEESTQSYHEEKLDDKTHHGGGWKGHSGTASSTAPGTASTTTGTTAVPASSSGMTSGTTGPAETGLLEKGQGEPIDPYETGPASKTVGPHKSNIMNILDPRIKPEPEKMHEHTTVGPHQSDTMNTIDPRVTHQPEKALAKETQGSGDSYGRDAALVGGAGAAGAVGAGAYATEQEHPTTTDSGPGSVGAGAYSVYDGGRQPQSTTTQTTSATHPHDPTTHHSAHDPYTVEHHADRDLENREQTKGGMFGFLHKNQDSKYADKLEPDTTARDKYYGTDNVTHSFDHHDPVGSDTTHGTFTGDPHSSYRANPLQQSSHDAFYHDSTGHGTSHGTSSALGGKPVYTTEGAAASNAPTTLVGDSPSTSTGHRESLDGEGKPKKRGLMDRILHRESPNKLHKEP